MDASHPSRPLGRIMTALCAAVVLLTGTINVAGAQTLPDTATAPATTTATTVATDEAASPAVVAQATPKPSSPPAGQTRPPGQNNPAPPPSGGTPATPVRPLPPLSHLPIIDFVVTFTQPAYYGSAANIRNYDPIDIGGTVRIPITRKLNLFFDRVTEGTLNQPLECVIVPGGPPNFRTCPNASRDILLQYHATYAFDRFLSMDIGESFRHRIWNGGNSGVSTVPFLCNNNGTSTGTNCTVSSTEHHFGYLGFSYTTKPVKELLRSTFVFSLTGDRQNVDKNVAVLCSAGNIAIGARCAGLAANQVGYIAQSPTQSVYYETTQGISMIVPVDPRHGTSLLLNERWGALNFYENATFSAGISQPYRWGSALTYQLSKRFSPGMTIALRHSDFHSLSTQGTPFPTPNHIHVGSWDVIGTFHVDTNTFFH